MIVRRLAAGGVIGAIVTAWLGFAIGCASAPKGADAEPLHARFFLESRANEAGMTVQLPQSGVTLRVGAKPVITEYDIVDADVVQVDLGRCLRVRLKPAAARDLYRLSVSAVDRRLVLALNDRFLGARRIEGAMTDGTILVFVEVPDAQLPELVARLNRTSAALATSVKNTETK